MCEFGVVIISFLENGMAERDLKIKKGRERKGERRDNPGRGKASAETQGRGEWSVL